MLLDPEDCIVAKFGPFTLDPVDPAVIAPLWKGAALGTLPCDEPEPGLESGPEPFGRPESGPEPPHSEPEPDIFVSDVPDVIEFVDIFETIDDAPSDLPTDTLPELPPELPGDVPESPDWWCQVAPVSEPPGPGEALPFFTCVDVNPASPTVGEVVSKVSMKERVWLAYAGSGG